MDAVLVLAAGLGTRLRPLSDECPKSLVPVGDAAMIDHVVARARAAGARVAANAHHHLEAMRAWAARAGVALSEEPEDLLGTAGGVARLRTLVGAREGAWIHNGDIDAPFVRFEVSARARSAARALLVVAPRAAGEGNVGLVRDADASGAGDAFRVVRLRREAFATETAGGDFLGIHWLHGDVPLPERGCMVGDVYLPALRSGARIEAVMYTDDWHDVGTLEGYLRANLAWLSRRGTASTWLGAGAQMNAECTQLIAGAGSRIDAPCTRVVAWPGVHVVTPLVDAVVTPRGTSFPRGLGSASGAVTP